jgi:Transposase DDE domain
MTDAKALHRDLMKALLTALPRTVYRDIRRVVTLAWAVVGLCLTRTVRLTAWAEVVDGHAQYAASRVRRFARWLHHAAIDPMIWYPPVLKATLRDWTPNNRVYVALDTTVLAPFVLIRASLVYRGRAIPLAWKALRHASATVSFEAYQPVLDHVRPLLPSGSQVTLLADRGFLHEQLIRYAQQHRWHFRIRMPGNTLVQVRHHAPCAVEHLRPVGGQAHFYHNVAMFGTALSPLHLVVAQPADAPTDPWYIASDQPTSRQTLDEYGLRFDIEENFLDDKSGGFQVQTSELQTPEALERLFLILAIATLHFTSTGVEVVRADVRRWVDTHWERGLSYLKIGWRWLKQQYRRGWRAFATFRLDPAPDPMPAIASRRQAGLPNRQWILVQKC